MNDPDDPITAIVIGSVLAATAAGAQVAQSRQAARDTKAAGRKQEAEAARLQADLERQREDEEAVKERGLARQRQRQRGLAAAGRQGNILTSPLGLLEPRLPAGAKTLLGE